MTPNENCEPFRPRLTALADGELTEAEATRVREHVAGCADCQSEWNAQAELYDLIKASESTQVDDITGAVLARLHPSPTSLLSEILHEVRTLRGELQFARAELQALRGEVARLRDERPQTQTMTGPYLLPYAVPTHTPALPLSPGARHYA
jgi:anti-sigma factor RsiW